MSKKTQCPLNNDPCSKGNCINFVSKCNFFRAIIERGLVEVTKQCPECEYYLLPFQGVWLHPENNSCTYSNLLSVDIKIHAKAYEDAIGSPSKDFNEIMMLSKGKKENVAVRAFKRVKSWFNKQ